MIPVSAPFLTPREEDLVAECVRSGWISSVGKYLDQFEQQWSNYCDMPYGIAVANGSVALDVALGAVQLNRHEEVILPTFTIISCAGAIVARGGIPVLVDMHAKNWQMDVSQIEAKITPRTRGIMPVHIYGHPVDMDPLLALAEKYGLWVIEDAAEVHGALYKGKKCGGLGHLSTFSFYANKLITTGEGGMVLTRSEEHAERARSLRNLCFQKKRRFLHEELGNNFRLTNLQAALAIGQIERIEEIVDRKRQIAAAYHERLKNIEFLELPVEESWAKNVYWVYGLMIKEDRGLDASTFAAQLFEKGIETRPFFLGMHEQPVFHRMGLFKGEQYPVADRLARQGLYIPSGLGIKDFEIDYVAATIRQILCK